MREEREGENRFALSHAGAGRCDPLKIGRSKLWRPLVVYTRCRFTTGSDIAEREGEQIVVRVSRERCLVSNLALLGTDREIPVHRIAEPYEEPM